MVEGDFSDHIGQNCGSKKINDRFIAYHSAVTYGYSDYNIKKISNCRWGRKEKKIKKKKNKKQSEISFYSFFFFNFFLFLN